MAAAANRLPKGSSRSRSATWPTRSSTSRCSAATTSPATRCAALAARRASTPAWSPMREQALELKLQDEAALEDAAEKLAIDARDNLIAQGVSPERVRVVRRAHLKYEGTDTALIVALGPMADMVNQFEAAYRKQFSFLMPGKPLIVEAVSVEVIASGGVHEEQELDRKNPGKPVESIRVFTGGKWHAAPLYRREDLGAGQRIDGPAVIAEANATTVVEPEWRATVTPLNHLVLDRVQARRAQTAIGTQVDPVM